MSDTLNQQNGGVAPQVGTSNYQSILSKNGAPQQNRNIYRSGNDPNLNEGNTYLTFAQRVEQSPYLVSFEQQNAKKNKKPKKKIINSYVANKDKLLIPKPERVHQGIDIFKNLIEEEKKVVTADLGIQSDEIEYNEEEFEKPFLPQKLGKDVGTQIWDDDLFDFDRDVQPLLTVICGKTLEQSMLELEQEEELENLREAKLMFSKRKNEDNKRIKNLEDREIQRKYNNDAKKDHRNQMREKRNNIKSYFKDLFKRFSEEFL